MGILIGEYEAQDLAFRRDRMFPIKILCWGTLAVFFYAEQLWRAGTLLIASIVCSFATPCMAGDIGSGWLWAAFLGRWFLVAGVTWYAMYALAWISLPGWRPKLAGFSAIVLFPLVLLATGLLFALITLKLGLPIDAIFDFEYQRLPPWWRD